jgi:hypothetical protein
MRVRRPSSRSGADLEETLMRRVTLSLPELAFVAVTRGIAGAGVGLLLAGYLGTQERKRIGLALLAVGALTTLPIAREVLVRRRAALEEELV